MNAELLPAVLPHLLLVDLVSKQAMINPRSLTIPLVPTQVIPETCKTSGVLLLND
jgi:hypothetical protein